MRILILLFLGLATVACSPTTTPIARAEPLPAAATDRPGVEDPAITRTTVLAGGCFWCIEAVFESVTGITRVVSGYAGGAVDDANYRAVSAGRTRHAEVVEITYHPATISYGTLLRIFFTVHDPTQLNRQGPDHGRQYRSAIFYADTEEQRVAADYIAQLNASGCFDKPIATRLEKLERFYPAEAYHQDFVRRNPNHGYVRAWVPPKLQKLKKHYPALVKQK